MTGDRKRDDGEAASASDSAGESASVDSLMRAIVRAPGLTPPGSTLESSGRLSPGLAPGVVIAGRFRLERMLGEGGMGVVWAAMHSVTRKPVALKFLKRSRDDDDTRAVHRFLREARAACAVRHPSVVEVHDVLELEDGSPVMVMDLLTGETLAQRLSREGVMSLPDLARIMVHVCSAVGCAHALGIVHRDLKPENIFLAQSPSGSAVKVLDFGIAKLTASEGDAAQTGIITGTGAILGTPYYMAPEQLFGEKDIDHRADIWALGIIFYEALTGERPTRGENVGQIYKVIMTDAIVPLRKRARELPGPFVELVERMLSRDRGKRPADMNAVLAVLAGYTDESFVVVGSPAAGPLETDPAAPGASNLDGAPNASRSGIEVPSRMSVGRLRQGPVWTTLAAVAVSAIGLGGVVTWRAHALQAPSGTATAASIGPVLTASPVRIASAPPTIPIEPAAPPMTRASESSPSFSPAIAPSHAATASPMAGRHPRPVAPSPRSEGASTPPPAASSLGRPAVIAPPPVDPGSYQ